jgi:hypothetical protein
LNCLPGATRTVLARRAIRSGHSAASVAPSHGECARGTRIHSGWCAQSRTLRMSLCSVHWPASECEALTFNALCD